MRLLFLSGLLTLILGINVQAAVTDKSKNKNFLSAPDTAGKADLPKAEPFSFGDFTWLNGNDRREEAVLKNDYFTGSAIIDANYSYSFNNPIDNTIVGSTALARDNEMEISYAGVGGDFNYKNAHGRIMTQFGTRSTVVPRNDYSPYRGQYDLGDAYRHISEAYAGYHFNAMYGINVDFGMFMSYLGLNSYYQVENWEYQASFTSDNTPWFFNGMRIQIFPTDRLKFEAWLINGWQSYGKFNTMPGVGGNITWSPTENFKILTNDYVGTDAPGLPSRTRYHSDNSMQLRYFKNKSSNGISQAAFCTTFDIGFESGAGVRPFDDDSLNGIRAQNFLSGMVYHRLWFRQNHLAWTIGGGIMTNPGRYLVLYPTGQASPLPDPNNPTQTAGAFPFSANPGDKFSGWDCSTNLDWMPNQSLTFRIEFVHREANVPYFAGRGGVTSPSGYSTTPIPAGWKPDLVKKEDRVIFAMLFRI